MFTLPPLFPLSPSSPTRLQCMLGEVEHVWAACRAGAGPSGAAAGPSADHLAEMAEMEAMLMIAMVEAEMDMEEDEFD